MVCAAASAPSLGLGCGSSGASGNIGSSGACIGAGISCQYDSQCCGGLSCCGAGYCNDGLGSNAVFTYPICQGTSGATGPASLACTSCLHSSCGSQLASEQSSCCACLTCYQGCLCSDLSCLQGCESEIDGACQSAEGPFTSCMSQNCASPCTATTGSDGGTG